MARQQRIDELEAALSRIAEVPDGLAAVEAARDLREAAERLERAHIKAARGQGVSWARIGSIYGLSKQGAQQRFAKRDHGTPPPSGPTRDA